MKKVFQLICIGSMLLAFSACKKRDVHVINGKLTKCDFATSSDPGVTLFKRSGAFAKTYAADGLAKTLTAVAYKGGLNTDFDSLYYSFAYTGNTIQVTLKAIFYKLRINDDGSAGGYYPEGAPRNETFSVVIDGKTGWATSANGQSYAYKNGRLDVPYLKYDSRGNIIEDTRMMRTVYEYDYSKTAKQQFYFSTAKDETFTLLELMGWIPVAPTHLLKHVQYTDPVVSGNPTYVYANFNIADHQLNKDGFLTSYTINTEPVQVSWNCTPVKVK